MMDPPAAGPRPARQPGGRAPGETLDYSYPVTNRAPGVMTDVQVLHDVPPGCEVLSASHGAKLAGGRLHWRLGDLPAGETVTVSVRIRPGPGAAVSHIARFWTLHAEPTPLRQARLEADLECPARVARGLAAAAVVTVRNRGTAPADAVALVAGGESRALGVVGIGEALTIEVPLATAAPGDFEVPLSLESGGAAVWSAVARYRAVGPALGLTWNGPEAVYVARADGGMIVLTNNGNAPLTGVRVRLALSPGVSYVTPVRADDFEPDPDDPSAWVTAVPDLAPAESARLRVPLAADAPGEASALALVAADGLEPTFAERRFRVELDPEEPHRALEERLVQLAFRERAGAARPERAGDADAGPTAAYVFFELGAARMGLPLAAVGAVTPTGRVTAVPSAPAWVDGVTYLQGEVTPVARLSRVLGLPDGESRRWLLTRVGGKPVALAVGRTLGIRDVPDAAVRPLGGVADPGFARRTRGIADLGGAGVVLLEPDRLID